MIQWKTIEHYPDYEVSNTGQVRNKITDKLLKPTKNNKRYLQVGLYNNGSYKKKKIHRLVAEAFIENLNSEEFTQVNHKNLCKADNRVENLEWCNRTYNTRHKITNGHCAQAKLNYKQASKIRELLLLGANVNRIAEKYDVSESTIYNIRAGRRWSRIDRASEYLQ